MLKNMRVLRDEYNISQQKLAEAIGVTQPSINKYENHDIEPDITTLIKIADFFDTSVDYVIGHTHIRRKIEEVCKYALNEQEALLMDGYRALPDSSRQIIHDLITDMLKK